MSVINIMTAVIEDFVNRICYHNSCTAWSVNFLIMMLFNDFNTAKENDMRIEYVIFDGAFPMSVGTQNENVRILHTVINELTNRFTTLSAVSKGDFYSEKTKDAVRTLEAIFGMPDSGIVSQSFYSRLIDELYAHRRAYQK